MTAALKAFPKRVGAFLKRANTGRWRWLFRVGAGLLALVLLLAMLLVFFTNCRWGLFRQENPYGVHGAPVEADQLYFVEDGVTWRYNPDVINLLVLGTDPEENRANVVFASQADTILLFTINTKTGTVDMLPIPRDIVVPVIRLDVFNEIAFTEPQPICTAYAYGDGALVSGQLMEAAVSYLLYGIPIHRFAAVGLDGLWNMTDYVGGVPVEVTPDFAHMTDVPVGETVLLDGEMAEEFVRGRSLPLMDGSNLSRMVRQRQYLFSLVNVVKQKTKADITFPFKLYGEMEPYVNTDLSFREMAYLAPRLMAAEEIQLHVMEGETVPSETQEVEYVVDEAFLRAYIKTYCFVPE